jgi:hypothetical protein
MPFLPSLTLCYCEESRFRGVARVPALCVSRPMPPHSPNALSSVPTPPAAPSSASPAPQPHAAHWLHRADLLLRVIIRLYIGFILVFLPWTHIWALNRFFLYYGPVAHLAESGAFRGIVSGLGLLNLWIAISEAIHQKEN